MRQDSMTFLAAGWKGFRTGLSEWAGASRWRPAALLLLAMSLASMRPEAVAQMSPPARASEMTPGDELLTAYLREEVGRLSGRFPDELQSAEDWDNWHARSREELKEMLGLQPLPPRTALKPVVTGTLDQEDFTVDKLYWQASPHLYCTANLYIPKGLTNPAPTVLYACGHWKLIRDGISYGNKAMYQVDGAWFARNGYVCLVLDTLLAGEVQGIHTGTRDHGLWWWNSLGYTPAGVEAWFGIRALDYLSTRPEVDTNRFGITGHSGGGAYSWSVTALDDRIRVAAPLAGMTTLEYHVLGNLMDSHCDCNFPVNLYRWDFPRLAALAAPRPLLIGGTDKDGLFPLAGTLRIHDEVRQVYGLLDQDSNLGLAIAPGIHDEVPELRLAVMRWFNRHLRGLDKKSEPPIVVDARRFFEPEELKVFEVLPTDAINSNIAASFVPRAPLQHRSAGELTSALSAHVFTGWPEPSAYSLDREPFLIAEREGLRLTAWDFDSQPDVPLRLYLLRSIDGPHPSLELRVLDSQQWRDWLGAMRCGFESQLGAEIACTSHAPANPDAFEALKTECAVNHLQLAFVAPRGVGLTSWSGDEKRMRRLRRRFMILGQTVDGMRVWDIRQTIRALNGINILSGQPLTLRARGTMAVDALYAALYEPTVERLLLEDLPDSQLEGPDYLGVLKITTLDEVKAALGSRLAEE